jgi:hypothetical protein
MIVMETRAEASRIHKGTTIQAIIEEALQIAASGKPVLDKIKAWSMIELNPEAEKRFAKQVLALRVDEAQVRNYDLDTLLAVRRPEDEAPTLWNVLNRTQEAIMKGHVRGRTLQFEGAGRALALKPITGISTEVEFNQRLWEIAERWGAFAKSGGKPSKSPLLTRQQQRRVAAGKSPR